MTPPKQEFTRKLFDLDLNHDGLTDFVFANFWGLSSSFTHAGFSVNYSFRKNEVLAGTGACAVGVANGKTIGPNHGFRTVNAYLDAYGGSGSHVTCPWADEHVHYLGLKFSIQGKTHYGWARFQQQFRGGTQGLTLLLSGYAYESVPNKPIVAGKTKGADVVTMPLDTGTLGHLALGRK
jgi:hypothetical protein